MEVSDKYVMGPPVRKYSGIRGSKLMDGLLDKVYKARV